MDTREGHPGTSELAGLVIQQAARECGASDGVFSLLHGLGRRWQVFLPLIPSLSLRWHIFAPDLRGHGQSTHVPRGYHGFQYSVDIVRFLRERVQRPAVLFGHSLGGMVAMWIAANEPELVRALIVGDSSTHGKGSPMTAQLSSRKRCSRGACKRPRPRERRRLHPDRPRSSPSLSAQPRHAPARGFPRKARPQVSAIPRAGLRHPRFRSNTRTPPANSGGRDCRSRSSRSCAHSRARSARERRNAASVPAIFFS